VAEVVAWASSAQRRLAWEARHATDKAMLERLRERADYQSWEDFYGGDAERREGEAKIGTFNSAGLQWRIIWSRTTEVVAWAFAWKDEQQHLVPVVESGEGGGIGFGPAFVPDMIFVLGRADSAEDAKRRWHLCIAGEKPGWDEMRAAFGSAP
jgi:hypothetical protein